MRLSWPFVAGLFTLALSFPASSAEYYAGKTIELVVGSAAGGGYDIYSRVIGRHLPRFIPGKPTIVIQNMPGAGGAKAAGFIYSVAPKDGTSIGAISPGSVMGPLLDDRTHYTYDPTKLIYLATANNATRVCVTLAQSKIKTFVDAQNIKSIIGTAGEGDSTLDYARLHKNTAGAKFDLVTGYAITPDILLAMERGEVDDVCGWDWSSLKSQKSDYIRDGKFNILVQVGSAPNKELTDMGVPEIWRFLPNDEARQVNELIVGQQLFGRPFVVPPGTSETLVATLRSAFISMMADREFLEDAARAKLDIVPSGGEAVQAGVAHVYGVSKEIVERAREAIRQ